MTGRKARAFGDVSVKVNRQTKSLRFSINKTKGRIRGTYEATIISMKKLLSLIAIVLLAALAAQAATDYGFSVAGVTVTSDNCSNIVSNYITSGTVSYDPSNNTLYMNNVTINMTGDYNRVINNLENSDLFIMFR